MSEAIQAERNKQAMSPKSGGRGLRDTTKSRDKNVRITSELYEEMMKTAMKRALASGKYNTDFHDICSEVWGYWKKHHKEGESE